MHCLCDMHCQSLLHTGWTVSFSKQKVEQGDTIYRKEYSSLLLHGHWTSANSVLLDESQLLVGQSTTGTTIPIT